MNKWALMDINIMMMHICSVLGFVSTAAADFGSGSWGSACEQDQHKNMVRVEEYNNLGPYFDI